MSSWLARIVPCSVYWALKPSPEAKERLASFRSHWLLWARRQFAGGRRVRRGSWRDKAVIVLSPPNHKQCKWRVYFGEGHPQGGQGGCGLNSVEGRTQDRVLLGSPTCWNFQKDK